MYRWRAESAVIAMFGEGLSVHTDGKFANSYLRAKKPVSTERVLRHIAVLKTKQLL